MYELSARTLKSKSFNDPFFASRTMLVYRTKKQLDEAAALRAAMSNSIRNHFESQYQPKREIPDELMHLLMQLDSTDADSQPAR